MSARIVCRWPTRLAAARRPASAARFSTAPPPRPPNATQPARRPCRLPLKHGPADGRRLSTLPPTQPSLSASPPPARNPLHILFCGTDDFSCVSLQALYDEMTASPASPAAIASIDVLVRPAKRTGRGLKTVVESPVRALAQQLGLPLHERDSFTGWSPPARTNMVVAVSFGLFVPPRILRACAYGGLNVHPSLLPDLHGAAPIEHAILLGRATTGVTVQTLHETTFDGGRRLLAAPPCGSESESSDGVPDVFSVSGRTAVALRARLAPVGARLLVEVIQRGLFVSREDQEEKEREEDGTATPAPKLSKADQEIGFTTAAQVDRQMRALGAVWTHVVGWRKNRPVRKRVIFEDAGLAACPALDRDAAAAMQTVTFQQTGRDGDIVLPVFVSGNDIILPIGVGVGAGAGAAALCVRQAKIEGAQTTAAADALKGFYIEKAASSISWDVVTSEAYNKETDGDQ